MELESGVKYVLNPKILEKKKIYIWFGRSEALRKEILSIFKLMLFYEIHVDGFASDCCEDIGLKIFNKEIVDIHTLDEKRAIVVTDSDIKYPVCQSIKVNISKTEMGKALQYPYSDHIEGYQLKEGTFLRIYRISEMEELLCGKIVYIYGTDKEARRFAKYLRLLDFNFQGFYEDFENINEEEIDGYPVNCVEDFVYESQGFVIIAGNRARQSIIKLGELNCQYLEDFVLAEPFAMHLLFVRKNALDINLGNTYIGASKYSGLRIPERNIQCKYPGFCIYGDCKGDNYRIVTLGGSTTDGNLFNFKSWSEILFEKIGKRNVTVWNGGVAGYTSGHELLKLIRDVLSMKPDMVIVFDGYNDTCQGKPVHPYSFTYVKEIFDYGADRMGDEYVKQQMGGQLCEGVVTEKTRFENWLSNIELMRDISVSRNIQFYSFLQPMLMSKIRNKRESEIYMSSRQFYEEELYRSESFRNEIKKPGIKENHEYIYDLSALFDNQSDVYMDICHVRERGNEIIAETIYTVIKNDCSLMERLNGTFIC